MLEGSSLETLEDFGALDQLSKKINSKKDTLFAIETIQQFEENIKKELEKNNIEEME